jgi:3-oxoacyl-[acyl-carrier protein] reductase
MDLQLNGRRALVCAASRGLGRACALALAAEGVEVTITGRDASSLAAAAAQIGAETGATVRQVVGDLATSSGREAALHACADPDILVTNSGGPPLGRLEDLSDEAWLSALASNMLGPMALIRHVHPGMRARRFGRIVNITSAYVKAPVELLPLSVGPRAGLTAAVSWLARAGCADNVTINNLLPEMIFTDRAREGFTRLAQEAGRPFDDYVEDVRATLPARRFGRPEEFGNVCAFLCSGLASYVTNQNIVVDGGHYAGLF